MRSDENDAAPLPPQATEALRALRRPVAPPDSLYHSVVAGLRARGALRDPRRRWTRAVGVAAAVGLAFVGGRYSAAPEVAAGPEYAFFLLNTPAARWPAGMTGQQIVEEFEAWASPLARDRRLVLAERLSRDRLLVDSAGIRVGDDAQGLNGLFVVRAAGLESATALARTLPHVRRGGVVAVQPLRGSR